MRSSAAIAKTTLLLVGTLLVNSIIAGSDPVPNNDCPCGYYDANTTDLWTDSIIVYFNETDSVPSSDFIIQNYEHKYELGWNTLFREGATPSNTYIGNSSIPGEEGSQSLELYCSLPTPDHLVEGGGIRTTRQDIFFGSFRAMFRGTPQGEGGSALSLQAFFNETQSWQMDNINPDDSSAAWISMISHNQFPDRSLGVNYTQIESDGGQPWNWTEHRVDWLRDEIRYYVGGILYRRVTRNQDALLPQTPSYITIKHWSIGNAYSTQGPPASRTEANVRWVRLFFNSSLTTIEDQEAFAARCQLNSACSINDIELRGSSLSPDGADLRWHQKLPESKQYIVPRIMAWTSLSTTACVLLFAFLRRVPWDVVKTKVFKFTDNSRGGAEWSNPGANQAGNFFSSNIKPSPWATPGNNVSGSSVVDPSYGTPVPSAPSWVDYSDLRKSKKDSLSDCETSGTTGAAWGRDFKGSYISSDEKSFGPVIAQRSVPQTPIEEDSFYDPDQILFVPRTDHLSSLPSYRTSDPFSERSVPQYSSRYSGRSSYYGSTARSQPNKNITSESSLEQGKDGKVQTETSVTAVDSSGTASQAAPKVMQRLDYLAGLIGIAALIETAIHFNLTFSAASIEPGTYIHTMSEVYARKTISPLLLNLNWIGLFLMISTRFLVSNFLKTGDLHVLAKKTVIRPFRLLIPITAISMVEYFLMDSGAIMWLEYLASVTWSTWPFATVPNNFGDFVSEILELAYLIPNAVPQITFNYCTGVLWTIPVQLQGSWQTIIAVVMVREIKTPWKRFTFYAWCILIHWYALSWATLFYLAIMLTDLEVTYDWKKWLKSHRLSYSLLIAILVIAFVGGLSLDFATQWTNVEYATYEYGVHPDPPTGLFIYQTPDYGYPQYYIPVSPSSI